MVSAPIAAQPHAEVNFRPRKRQLPSRESCSNQATVVLSRQPSNDEGGQPGRVPAVKIGVVRVAHIASARFEGFRSLRRSALDGLGDYVPIIGLNGSGKSNALRALNLFFNGEVDGDGATLDLSRDFTDHLKGKRREVAVEVSFDVSDGNLPKGTQPFVTRASSDNQLSIRRHWALATGTKQLIETVSVDGTVLESDNPDRSAALAFIRSVEYRYVPNHVQPADLLRRHVQTLQPTLVKRLKQTADFDSDNFTSAMDALAKVASNMFAPVSTNVTKGAREVQGITADLPSDFADLLFQVALRTVSSAGVAQLVESQGSGTQSFILMHALDLLDSAARERGFGWVQSHVWAIEEPESFLHSGLRAVFAEDLRAYAEHERRQILISTHQDEFVRPAESAWMAELTGGITSFAKMNARDALVASSRARITRFSHPILDWPETPLVLAEGASDVELLRLALRLTKRRPRWRLISMADIEPDFGGGDAVVAYLRANQSVLASRPESAPVLVLKDWEVNDKTLRQAKSVVACHPTSTAVRIPADMANPELGQQFRGIERFLETQLVRDVIGDEQLRPHSVHKEFPLGVDRKTLESAKGALVAKCRDRPAVGPHIAKVADWIDEQVEVALGAAPADLFF